MNAAAFSPVSRVLRRLERQSLNATFWADAAQMAGQAGQAANSERWGRWGVSASHRAAKLRRLVVKVAGGAR